MSLNIPQGLLEELASAKDELNNALPRLKEIRDEKVKEFNQITQSLQKQQKDYRELSILVSGDVENAITLLQNRMSDNQTEYCTCLTRFNQQQALYEQEKEWQKKAEEQKRKIEEKLNDSRSQLQENEIKIKGSKECQRTMTEGLKGTQKLEEDYKAAQKELREACQITETFLNLKMKILAGFSQGTQEIKTQEIKDKLNELYNIYASIDRNAIQEKQ